ncbi:hypothetical protein N9730_01095 [Gammaproteobacteria bacterium]|nr:hypothetical protein [Gammaproteobacteria bacterium]
MFVVSCSSIDSQEAGQFNYLSCQNIAIASQDIYKKYLSLGKDQTKSLSGSFKNMGNNTSVKIIAAKKDLEQLNYSAKLKGCAKISL